MTARWILAPRYSTWAARSLLCCALLMAVAAQMGAATQDEVTRDGTTQGELTRDEESRGSTGSVEEGNSESDAWPPSVPVAADEGPGEETESPPEQTVEEPGQPAGDELASDELAGDALAGDADGKQPVAEEAPQPADADGQPDAEPESPPAPPKPKTVGEPLAPGMMKLVQDEVRSGLERRDIYARFLRFARFAGLKLDSTSRRRTGSELTGQCRLSWYDHLLRNPLSAPVELEQLTRELHLAALGDHHGLAEIMATAAKKLDLARSAPRQFASVTSGPLALDVVRQCLIEAQVNYAAALAPLSKAEVRELTTNLNRVFTTENNVGHTLRSRSMGRRLCDLLERLDRNALHAAAEALLPLADPQLLSHLATLDDQRTVAIPGVTGSAVGRLSTPGGMIVVGGRQANTYRLDDLPELSVLIDLGGNDTYHDGTVSHQRPVLIVIDLDGDDHYLSTKPGVQGSAILGVSMLLDLGGNDRYQARDVAQASCLGGAGILIDYAGDDTYTGLRRVQGQALAGVGILIDRAGHDRYHAAMWAQGMGAPLGFGLLDDLDGRDHYYAGGQYINSYIDDEDNPTPGYEGWAQGMGGGPRQVANGGVGVILDGGGDDTYEFDYLAHGGGYWCGIGCARDFGGNDRRLGATEKAYGGGPRTQRRFQRFGTGFGCHYSVGYCFDDQGNDTYHGTIMGLGFAWDCSLGGLFDFGGTDQYLATGSTTQGRGAQAGFGVLFDFDGDDFYQGSGQGRASSSISYHDLPQCGGNFSFVIDYGGTDKYGCGARNNGYYTRGYAGGFLIDRPKRKGVEKTADKSQTSTTAGS